MGDLEPLSEIFIGDSNPNSRRQITETDRNVISQVEYAIQKQQVHYINYGQPWQACILPTKLTPTVFYGKIMICFYGCNLPFCQLGY